MLVVSLNNNEWKRFLGNAPATLLKYQCISLLIAPIVNNSAKIDDEHDL
jgi:hypothetical protein